MTPRELDRRTFLGRAGSAGVAAATAACAGRARRGDGRPNVLLFLTDDQSWMHVGCYGDPGVRTPNIDALAEGGVRFEHAYAASPSCVPSRSTLLTGQAIWRLEQGAVFGGTLPRKFPVYPWLLHDAGYHVGWTGKGWGPGNLRPGGWLDTWPQGTPYNSHTIDRSTTELSVFEFDYARNFRAFLDTGPRDAPFAFWCGITEPHPPYTPGSGLRSGKRLEDARVPLHLPRVPVVQAEILDYYLEIEYLDDVLGRMLAYLDDDGLLEDTLVVVTSDNGIALPRCKGTLYDTGTRMPFVASWPGAVPGGRVVLDRVELADVAPTFLEAAGVPVPAAMTGKSLLDVLGSTASGTVDPKRIAAHSAVERHGNARPGAQGYPMRSRRTERWLYVRNFEPELHAAGDPDFQSPISRTRRGYLEIADTPTKAWMLEHRNAPEVRPLFELSFGDRPAEELYDSEADPGQMRNLASEPDHAATLVELRTGLEEYLRATDDPRMHDEDPWDDYGWDRLNWTESTFGRERERGRDHDGD